MSGSASTPNITFQQIPSNLRISGAFVEIDPNANTGQQNFRSLIISQILATGTATAGVPVILAGQGDCTGKGGTGSMADAMGRAYYEADNFGEVWLLPLADPTGGVKATGTITLAGTATSSGTLSPYIAGQLVPLNVAAGVAAAATAVLLAAAINGASPSLPVTATVTGAVITLTCVHAGLLGNDIDLRANYLGTRGGEAPVPGLTMTFTAMSGGAGTPDLADALANLPPINFDYVAFPLNDTASLNEWQLFMNDETGRWSWEQMLWGGAFGALRGTLAAATTFLTGRNDPAISVTPISDAPEPVWAWAAELTAQSAVSLRANPAVPLQDITLNRKAPSTPNQFLPGERNTLLFDGGSTFTVNAAQQCVTDRLITTYQLNAAGVPDNSYLDVETRYTLAYVATDLRTYLLSLYSRKIFVDDSTQLTGSINNAVVTPNMIKASIISRYYYQAKQGLVQDADAFAAAVQVQKTGSMARILWPGDIANQLRQFGILIDFSKT